MPRETPQSADVRRALAVHASAVRAASVARFFKSGKGEYAEGDCFIGVTVPQQRAVARKFRTLSLPQIELLLKSAIHEERLTALLIMVDQFNRVTAEDSRGRLFRLYMKRRKSINNWDLVDASAEYIVGGWLADKPRGLLDRLAGERNLWSRRIAVLATFHYIKRGDAKDIMRIAARLLSDPHDLIHKAVGWMLRETGKRVDIELLRTFLRKHARRMPRTMLRYAIERLPLRERRRWMAC